MPSTSEAAGHVRMRHPIAVHAHGVPRVQKPWAVVVRTPSPRRDVPSPPVGRGIEIRVRHSIHVGGRCLRWNPHPTRTRQVHPLPRGIRLHERRLPRRRRRRRCLTRGSALRRRLRERSRLDSRRRRRWRWRRILRWRLRFRSSAARNHGCKDETVRMPSEVHGGFR